MSMCFSLDGDKNIYFKCARYFIQKVKWFEKMPVFELTLKYIWKQYLKV